MVGSWQQNSIRRRRGIPQGCPFSVVFCVLWGSAWSCSTRLFLAKYAVALSVILVYLDDLTVLSSSHEAMTAFYGFTGRFFQLWQVQRNPTKTAYLVNPRAKVQRCRVEGQPKHDRQRLLGCMTGWSPVASLLKVELIRQSWLLDVFSSCLSLKRTMLESHRRLSGHF